MPAIAASKISAVSVGSNTDDTGYATASASPVATTVYYVACAALRAAGQTVTPTLAGTNGWNVTWTQVATVLASNLRLTIFSGTTGASTTAGTLTATYTAETQDAHAIVSVALTSVVATAVQAKTGTAVAATSITVTFDSALANEWNGVLFFVANDATGGSQALTDNAYYYNLGTQTTASDGVRMNQKFAAANVSSMTMTGFSSSNIAAILIELDHNGVGVDGGGCARLIGPGGVIG